MSTIMPQKKSNQQPTKKDMAKIKEDLQELRKAVLADSDTEVVREAIDSCTYIINGLISQNIHLQKLCRKNNIDTD